MNFTREPIIETVITPREGNKLVIRNSKGGGQEEFFVDAVEVISFGNTSFFRSLEKPKSFLVPVNDYEILEVREARMTLKMTGAEKGIKIGGGRETSSKTPKAETPIQEVEAAAIAEQKADKRRERRRYRKKRGRNEAEDEAEQQEGELPAESEEKKVIPVSSLIPPPPNLISESILRRKAEEESDQEVEQQPEDHSQEEDEEIPF